MSWNLAMWHIAVFIRSVFSLPFGVRTADLPCRKQDSSVCVCVCVCVRMSTAALRAVAKMNPVNFSVTEKIQDVPGTAPL